MMPPPVNFEPMRVPTVEPNMDQFDASRVTFADQRAAAPTPPVPVQNYAPPPAQKIYAPPAQKIYAPSMRTQTPVQPAQLPPAPPPREPPPPTPVQLNVPDKVRAHCKSKCTLSKCSRRSRSTVSEW